MKWKTDTSKCKHGISYLTCHTGIQVGYAILTYLKEDDETVKFKGEGFYVFDTNWHRWEKCKQPHYWCELKSPIGE